MPIGGDLPGDYVLDIGPLEQFGQWFVGYWRERRDCWSTNTWGTCTEWSFLVQFQHMDMRSSVSAKGGGIVHSHCGAITQNDNIARTGLPRDASCGNRGICPSGMP